MRPPGRHRLEHEVELADGLAASHVQLAKINESPFRYRNWINRSEQILLSRRQQSYRHGDDRERITRARQAAEALFTSKPPVSGSSVPDTAPDQSARKPRVLAIAPTSPVRLEKIEAPGSPEPQTTHEIPRSQFARIRTWMEYGMTVAQVAELYGTAVGEIEHIIRQA